MSKSRDVRLRPTVSTVLRPAPDALRAWDRLVNRTPGTDVTQLSGWGALRASVGFVPLHLVAHRGSELVGGSQVLVRHVPMLGRVGYLPYGPVVAPNLEGTDQIQDALADAILALVDRGLRMMVVQPPEGGDGIGVRLLGRGFRPSSVEVAPAGSLRIDLTDDLASIRARFGRRLRSWPDRWPRRGVTVRLGGARDIPLLASLLARSAEHQGFRTPSCRYVASMYEQLAPEGHAAIFVGELRGVPVAADLVTMCAGMIRGRLTGLDRACDAARNSVPAAIRWEIIQWGKERGYRWLDFGGLRSETLDTLLMPSGRPRPQLAAVDQPKLAFGGAAYRYPSAVEMITPDVLRRTYDHVTSSAQGRQLVRRAQAIARRGFAL